MTNPESTAFAKFWDAVNEALQRDGLPFLTYGMARRMWANTLSAAMVESARNAREDSK